MPPPAPPNTGESSKSRSSPYSPKDDINRQKILVLGWRKAGKSSCIKTVFQDFPVKDGNIPYFGVTQKVEKIDYDSIIPLQIWDTPANFDIDQLEQLDTPIGSFSTIIYVLDMQQDDSYHEAVLPFVRVMLRAYLANPGMKFVIFIHKAEVVPEEYKGENYASIQRALSDELLDYPFQNLSPYHPNINFSDHSTITSITNHLQSEIRFDMTSVHEVSLRDAWSKVVQGVMDVLPAVEQLLVNFTGTSGMDNSFLFDMNARIAVAADDRGRNDATLDLVTEYLSRFLQFRDLYKRLRKPQVVSVDDDETHGEQASTEEDEEEEEGGGGGWWDEEDPDAPWMTQCTRLNPNTTIALWQFTPHLVLVALLRSDTWNQRKGMIEYNLTFLRQGVRRILMEVEEG